jgi:hypothetical protein
MDLEKRHATDDSSPHESPWVLLGGSPSLRRGFAKAFKASKAGHFNDQRG